MGSSVRRIAVAKPATRTVPAGSARGQNFHGMIRQSTARRREPDPPAVRFDQRRTHFPREKRNLLRHR